MRHGSLFSGIGGFDLAAEWMGWENVFHCEWMEFPRKVLDYHFPNADSHIDICKTDFKKYANKIDILTGGFPCQPFSLAGKRKGTDDERYLWGEMLRAIQEIKPKFVIAENVFGITNIDGGLVFQQVCLDLENEGYEVQPFIIPAAAKNAPHRRDRCWFIAYTSSNGGQKNSKSKREENEENTKQFKCIYNNGYASNTNGNGFNECNGINEINTSQGGLNALCDIDKSNGYGNAPNSSSGRIQRHGGSSQNGKFQTNEFNQNNSKRQSRMDWENFPTQSPVCGGNDGIPTELDGITFSKWRAESIKGYGNAIVPQIAYSLFEIIQELNENN
jgi:DNA (cytosine-5)-methyltransferase 1